MYKQGLELMISPRTSLDTGLEIPDALDVGNQLITEPRSVVKTSLVMVLTLFCK